MKRIFIGSKTIPYSNNIKEWILKNVKDPMDNCFFYSGVLSILDPSLTLKKGKPANPNKGETAHFYLEDSNGNIIDPTKEQLKKNYQYEGKSVNIMKNLDEIINDELFSTLHHEDRDKILKKLDKNERV